MGIHGVWDDVHSEFIWTVRARINKGTWTPLKYGIAGDWLSEDGTDQTPDTVYECVDNLYTYVTNGAGTKVPTPVFVNGIVTASFTKYTKADHPDFFNELTISFNELKNGFSTPHRYLPKIYAKWKRTFISQSPLVSNNALYIHNIDNQTFAFFTVRSSKWYDQIDSTPFIQMILNQSPDVKKDFIAIELNSDSNYTVSKTILEFLTDQHQSFLLNTDIEKDELHDNLWTSPIKNDSSVAADNPLGLNDIDTSSLYGRYLLVKYNFSNEKLFGVYIKTDSRSRLNTT